MHGGGAAGQATNGTLIDLSRAVGLSANRRTAGDPGISESLLGSSGPKADEASSERTPNTRVITPPHQRELETWHPHANYAGRRAPILGEVRLGPRPAWRRIHDGSPA